MLDVLGVVWTIIWAVLKYPIGLVIIFFGAVAIGLQCLVGNQGACSTFPHTFFELLRVAGICLLGAGVLFALWRPRLVIAYLHYFFVPHPGDAAMRASRVYRIRGKIDTKDLAAAAKRDVASATDPRNLPPIYRSENQRKKAEALQKLAEADRKLFDEIEARERARRRMEKAKRGED